MTGGEITFRVDPEIYRQIAEADINTLQRVSITEDPSFRFQNLGSGLWAPRNRGYSRKPLELDSKKFGDFIWRLTFSNPALARQILFDNFKQFAKTEVKREDHTRNSDSHGPKRNAWVNITRVFIEHNCDILSHPSFRGMFDPEKDRRELLLLNQLIDEARNSNIDKSIQFDITPEMVANVDLFFNALESRSEDIPTMYGRAWQAMLDNAKKLREGELV